MGCTCSIFKKKKEEENELGPSVINIWTFPFRKQKINQQIKLGISIDLAKAKNN